MYSTTEPQVGGVIGAPASVQTISCLVFVLAKAMETFSVLEIFACQDLSTGWFCEHITLVHIQYEMLKVRSGKLKAQSIPG